MVGVDLSSPPPQSVPLVINIADDNKAEGPILTFKCVSITKNCSVTSTTSVGNPPSVWVGFGFSQKSAHKNSGLIVDCVFLFLFADRGFLDCGFSYIFKGLFVN